MTARLASRLALRTLLFAAFLLMADRVIAGVIQCRALGTLPTGLWPW
jgi:hypothetical protein